MLNTYRIMGPRFEAIVTVRGSFVMNATRPFTDYVGRPWGSVEERAKELGAKVVRQS